MYFVRCFSILLHQYYVTQLYRTVVTSLQVTDARTDLSANTTRTTQRRCLRLIRYIPINVGLALSHAASAEHGLNSFLTLMAWRMGRFAADAGHRSCKVSPCTTFQSQPTSVLAAHEPPASPYYGTGPRAWISEILSLFTTRCSG